MRASAGPFVAAAGVQTDKTAESLTEFFKELEAIRTPIPRRRAREGEELRRAAVAARLRDDRQRRRLARAAVRLQPARRLLRDLHGPRPGGHGRGRAGAAAQKYIQPEKFAVVIVGDRKVIEPAIKALNLGPDFDGGRPVAEVMK